MLAHYLNPNVPTIYAANTTANTLVVPVTPGVQYRATVTAACFAEDGCTPSTMYGQYVSAHPLVFTADGSSKKPAGGLSTGAKAGAAVGVR
jgi:hypothetical protein